MDGYIKFLRHVLGEDWIYGNFGHESIGYPAISRRVQWV